MSLHLGLRTARDRACRPGWVSVFSLAILLLSPLARASVQLTTFSVTSPPPPESQPGTSRHYATTMTPTNDLPTNDPTVGTMAGSAATDGGASTYSVPIVVPPGRAGMQPSLALTYNSRSGNGVAGMGWTIAGVSSIHRCPQTMEQDGNTQGVTYGNSDRLCLDGQRLVAVSGTYGQANAQYRTEVDSYARITQVGGSLTGNATCFVVEEKDGRILHYGAVVNGVDSGSLSCAASSAHARVQPAGAGATLSWLVQQIADRVGNYQSYTYATSQGSDVFGPGEVLLSTVTYTGFGTTPGNRTVTFSYEPRATAASGVTDVGSSYLAGGLTLQTQALQSITTAVAGVTARVYQPGYVTSAYSGRLLMAKLQECAGSSCSPTQTTCPAISSGSACHPATQFIYNDDALNTAGNFPFVALNAAAIPFGTSDQSQNTPLEFHSIGDLDGDGTRETAVATNTSAGEQIYLVQATADRVIHAAVNLTGTAFDIEPTSYADIDGDGRAKLLELPATSGTLSFGVWSGLRGIPPTLPSGNTPAQNFAALFTSYPSNIPFTPGDTYYTGDFKGNGKIDIVRVKLGDTNCSGGHGVYIYLNAMTGVLGSSGNTTANFTITATPAFCMAVTSGSGTITVQNIDHIGDFNGDGLPDFYLRTDTTIGSATYSHFDGVQVTQPGGTTTTLENCAAIGLVDNLALKDSTDVCNWSEAGQPTNFVTFMDVNGDGLEDIVLARSQQQSNGSAVSPTWRVILNQGGTFGSEIDTGSTEGLIETGGGMGFRYLGRLPSMDVDSDGKPDLLVPSTTQGFHGFALKMCTVTTIPEVGTEGCPAPLAPSQGSGPITGVCPVYSCPEDPSGSLDMPTGTSSGGDGYTYTWNGWPAYGTYNASGPHDPEPGLDNSAYHLAMLKFEQTGAAQFTVQRIETPLVGRLSGTGVLSGRTDSLFGDGLADLTSVLGCTNKKIPWGSGGATINQCSTVVDSNRVYGPAPSDKLPDGTPICTIQTDGSCTFDENPVLYTGINEGVIAFGGSPALRVAQPQAKLAVSGTTPLANQPVLPGLLNDAINGVGDTVGWAYAPLSYPQNPAQNAGVVLYTVPSAGGYVDSRHYYFQSSMPVVTGMAQSSGTGEYGTGSRSALYAYSEAMYNHFGRGFTGFRTILAETSNAATTRLARTVTTYNQKFPLIGKVAEVVTSVPNFANTTNAVVRDETDNYICTLGNRAACPVDSLPTPTGSTVYAPVLDNQTAKTFDLGTGSQDGEADTVNAASASAAASGWDANGNLTTQQVTQLDKGSPSFLDSTTGHTTTTSNTYAAADTTNWWINKLTQSSVTASIAYSGTHALPSGASTPQQSITTNYTWNADRTPSTKTVQAGITNQQSVTTYCYPQAKATTSPSCPLTTQTTSYGLPTLTKVCLGYYDSNGKCSGAKGTGNGDPGSALSPERTTGLSYTSDGSTASADGYFVLDMTNALSQTTSTTHAPADGTVLTTQDPNGVQVIDTRDAFGRVLDVQHLGNNGGNIDSMIQSAYTSCLDTSSPPNPGHCPGTYVGEDGNETNAAYRVTTVQTGYPTQVAWYDLLGRKIKQGHRGFDGTFIATLSDFDDMGTVADTSTPYLLGNTAFFTGFTYDALNRPTKKIAPGAEADPTHGDVQTDYTYSGRVTNLTVHATKITLGGGNTCPSTAKNLCLQMSRSQNVLGQWMQTTQSPILNGTTTTLTTNYWTEPLGHVAAMKDAEGNITTASYNALGQRTQSADPDQGTWNFTYDALGELLTQTDPRGPGGVGVVTTINSRDGLGRTTERQQVPPASAPTGLAFETELDDWSFDPANGIGELGQVQRRRGTGTTVPAQTATPVWQEVYTFEQHTARPSTITTTINDANNVVLSTSMDYDTDGRPNTHTYPSGLIVQNGYTAYGQLDELSNKSTGTAYWTAAAENEWGHVTSETFTGSITGSHQDYHSTGQAYQLSWSGKDQFLYGYDSFGNLISQSRSVNASNGESFTYDPLQRLTQSARTTGAAVNYGYTASGNVAYKDNFSVNSGTGTPAYSYASANSTTNNCGPHAANAVTLPGGLTATYTCDANGNVIGGDTITATFDADNHPRTLVRTNLSGGVPYEPCATGHTDNIFCDGFEVLPTTQTTGNATWAYDSNGTRYYESSALQGTRYYGPDGYELVITSSGTVSKQELGPVIVTGNGTSTTVVLRDRLGSTLDTIDGTNLAQRAYAPFGATRNGDMSDRQYGMLNLTPDTIHGFTSHTHEDDTALIHMGGRIYDYNLGRFLSVDPLIQNPLSSQGLNPYSYLGNSPLAGKDPTGYAGVDQSSICFRSPGACGEIYGTDSVSAQQSASQSNKIGTSGASRQGANSVIRVDAANAGNPNVDLASRPDGGTSSTGNNGGSCQVPYRCDGGAAATQDYGSITGLPPSMHERMQAFAQQSWAMNPLGAAGTDIFDSILTNVFQVIGAASGSHYNTYTEMSVNGVYPGLTAAAGLGMMLAPGGEVEGFVGSAIEQGAEKQTATLIVGEGMNRVQAMAAQMKELGVEVRTYAAENMNRLMNPNAYGSSRSLDANQHWLDYWVRKNGADVIDIGRQPGRTTASPYYEMESRSLKRWEQSGQIAPVARVNPGY